MTDMTNPEDVNILRSRYHQFKHYAKTKRLTFAWESFQDFLTDVVRACPNTSPKLFRISFDQQVETLGYCLQTMSIREYKETEGHRKTVVTRKKAHKRPEKQLTTFNDMTIVSLVSANLAVFLACEDFDATVDDLVDPFFT